jgi:hypothetical protein
MLVLVGLLGFVAVQPRVANALGYALPGPSGLPYRVSFAGRDYDNDTTCAGAGWCRVNGPLLCTAGDQLREAGTWPLQQVGWLFTLFALPRPLLRAPTPRGMTTMTLYVPRGRDCYLAYALSGGP